MAWLGEGGDTGIRDVPKAVTDRLEEMLQWCWREGGKEAWDDTVKELVAVVTSCGRVGVCTSEIGGLQFHSWKVGVEMV